MTKATLGFPDMQRTQQPKQQRVAVGFFVYFCDQAELLYQSIKFIGTIQKSGFSQAGNRQFEKIKFEKLKRFY